MEELDNRVNIIKENRCKTMKYEGLECVEVDSIVDTRIGKDQKRYYFVCFKSWIPEEKLLEYEDLIKQFWKQKHGQDGQKLEYMSDEESHSDKENKYKTQDDCTSNRTPTFVSKEFSRENNVDQLHNENDSAIGDLQDDVLQTDHDDVSLYSDKLSPAQEIFADKSYNRLPENEVPVQDTQGSDDGNLSDNTNDDSSMQLNNSTEYSDAIIANDEKSNKDLLSYANEQKDNFRPSSSTSDHHPIKKRKTLDDIVRKISGTNDQPAEKRSCIDDVFSNRLQTLDETLLTNQVKSDEKEQEDLQREMHGADTYFEIPAGDKLSPNTNGNRKNVYWSGGKAFKKSSRAYKCPCCDAQCPSEEILFEHTQTHTTFPCQFCNEVLQSLAEYAEHQKLHNNKYTCRICNDKFRTIAAFEMHRITVHKPRLKYEKCRMCSMLYSDPAQLRRHEKLHLPPHLRSSDENERPPPPPLYRRENGGPPPLIQDDIREFPQYQSRSESNYAWNGYHDKPRNETLHERNGRHEVEDSQRVTSHENEGSAIRNPIRNLLGKIHHSQQSFEFDRHPHSSFRPFSKHRRDDEDQNKSYHDGTQGLPYPVRVPNHLPVSVKDENTHKEERDSQHFRELVYLCAVCNKSFGKKETFDIHWRSAHADTPVFACDICKETFYSKEIFESHMNSHVNQDFVCGICKRVFDQRSSYETHMRLHAMERQFQCQVCARSFSLRENLERHMSLHAEVPTWRCNFCPETFRRPGLLESHVAQHHARQMDDLRRQNENINNSKNQPSNGSPASPIYHKYPTKLPSDAKIQNISQDQFYPNRHHYIDDSKIFIYDPKMTNSVDGPRNIPLPLSASDSNLFLKEKMEESKQSLITLAPAVSQPHYSSVKKVSPPPAAHHSMKCEQCGEEFTSSSLFEIHLRSHVQEVFNCPKCPRTFTKRSVYDTHVQSHDTSKSHNCPYCQRSFSMKGNLRRHIRIHTNEAPYECPICFQRFRRSDGLKGHIKRHETMGESAPTDMVPSQASA